MKKILILLLISFNVIAQDKKDSLLALLKKHPQQDIQRCYILRELRKNEVRNFENGDVYDKEAYEIALKKIPTVKNNLKLLNEYKSFLSDYYYDLAVGEDNLETGKHYILKSIRIEQDIKRYTDLGCSYQALGQIYIDMGDIPNAEKYFTESIKVLLFRKGDVAEENNYLTYSYDKLANINYNRGDFQKAIQMMYEKLKIIKQETSNYSNNTKINTYNLAATYNKLGFFYAKEGEDKKAMSCFMTALKIEKTIDDKDGIALIYRNIGTFYLDRNDFKKANYYFDLSTKLSKSETVKIDNIASKGKLYLKKNDIVNASIFLDKAFKYAIENDSKRLLPKLYYDLAQVNIKKNNLKLAQEYAQKSYEISQQKSNVLETQKSAELLYLIHKKNNNKSEALKMLEITHILGDSINKKENKNATLKGEFKYETELKEAKIKDLSLQKQISELESTRKTTLIYSILGGILALGAIAYFSFTRFKEKKANELLTTQLDEAQKRIEIEQKATESELKALKSQMNPHFMFNALNSIQEQFMYGDKFIANEQMGKFTYLTRQILSISSKKKINISTEIEVLTKYLDLEKMRFSSDFDFQIKVSDSIDEDYHQVPPMIIQPFVENALKHGLFHKNGDKKLTVEFNLDKTEKYIFVDIEDNGIGRKKAAELQIRNPQTHDSFSMNATIDRLKLADALTPAQDLLKIEDLYDQQGNPAGTRVRVLILIS